MTSKRDDLKYILTYRRGDYYLGSLAHAQLAKFFKIYNTVRCTPELIDEASDEAINAAHEQFSVSIGIMREYPATNYPALKGSVTVTQQDRRDFYGSQEIDLWYAISDETGIVAYAKDEALAQAIAQIKR
jgi:hypothetical protein